MAQLYIPTKLLCQKALATCTPFHSRDRLSFTHSASGLLCVATLATCTTYAARYSSHNNQHAVKLTMNTLIM